LALLKIKAFLARTGGCGPGEPRGARKAGLSWPDPQRPAGAIPSGRPSFARPLERANRDGRDGRHARLPRPQKLI